MRKFTGDRLVLATHNAGKKVELDALLAPLGIGVISAKEWGLPEPAETETTFAGNARIKAHFAAQATGLPALADDSGIIIDALDGQPGVYTADWAETPRGRDFALAMAKAWVMLSDKTGPFTASFNSTLCLAWPDGHDEIYEGRVSGILVWPPRGQNGFGYDPMFLPLGQVLTFGEMTPAAKAKISHRTLSFDALLAGAFDGMARAASGALPASRDLQIDRRAESATLYHGTRAVLKSGDMIVPGHMTNYGTGKAAVHVYLSATLEAAIWGAELAQGDGLPRIYTVEPTGPIYDDPNLTDKKFPGNPTKSYRTRQPLRVVDELSDWQGHSPEQIAAIKAGLEKLKSLGVQAVDD